jgi:pilus assembly protein CpaE
VRGTTLAVNLAYEIAHLLDRRCILADLSLTVGMVATSLNVEPRYTMQDLLADVGRVDVDLVRRVLHKVTDNLSILAGPGKIIAPPPNPAQDVLHVIQLLEQLTDVVVLDVPCTYNDLYFEVLASAGQVVLVCEQKVPSIRSLKLVREALGRADAADREYVVINRYDPRVQGFAVADLARLLQVRAWYPIDNDWAAVVASGNHGVPLRLQAPQSGVLKGIDALARTLLALDVQPAAKGKDVGVFGRMRRAFSQN